MDSDQDTTRDGDQPAMPFALRFMLLSFAALIAAIGVVALVVIVWMLVD